MFNTVVSGKQFRALHFEILMYFVKVYTQTLILGGSHGEQLF